MEPTVTDDPLWLIKDILLRWSAGQTGALTGGTQPLVENDLLGTVQRLHPQHHGRLSELLDWMQSTLDPECWGSREAVQTWHRRHSPPDFPSTP
jgi:hypothetical protein